MGFIEGFLATILIWGIARLVPGFSSTLAPESIELRLVTQFIMLPFGWFVAQAVSRKRHPTCIRVNLWLFILAEVSGVFSVLPYVMESINTQYYYAITGIKYSTYWGLLAFEIAYIASCGYLVKKTAPQDAEGSQLPAYAIDNTNKASDDFIHDDMYIQAVSLVIDSKKATAYNLHTKLNIELGTCARMLDAMEQQGVIGPFRGDADREILMTQAQWYDYFNKVKNTQSSNTTPVAQETSSPLPQIEIHAVNNSGKVNNTAKIDALVVDAPVPSATTESDTVAYCRNCGNKLIPGAAFCNKCGSAIPKNNRCPSCNSEVTQDSVFCPKCSTKIQ